MNKCWIPAITALALLNGCASVQRGSIPVVDSSTAVSNNDHISASSGFLQAVAKRPAHATPQVIPQDSGVVVMVPGSGVATSAPISAGPRTPGPSTLEPIYSTPIQTALINQGTYKMPSTPSGIPSSNSDGLSADEQLDGPVLALLTTAQQQQAGGDLNGASSSLERAQRVAPREPQVLYRLAQVRMAQGDEPQAEQFALRGLTLASGRPELQTMLWALIGDARAVQDDAAGATQARQKAKVSP